MYLKNLFFYNLNVKLQDLLSESIYQFERRDSDIEEYDNNLLYLSYLDDIEMYVHAALFKNRYSEEAAKHFKFWVYTPAMSRAFTEIRTMLPIWWLAWSKSMLKWDYVPSDFQPWALAVLEWFDLERYHAAYHLPQEEYDAIKHDLPLVIEGLRNYPSDKFAPPVDENINI